MMLVRQNKTCTKLVLLHRRLQNYVHTLYVYDDIKWIESKSARGGGSQIGLKEEKISNNSIKPCHVHDFLGRANRTKSLDFDSQPTS